MKFSLILFALFTTVVKSNFYDTSTNGDWWFDESDMNVYDESDMNVYDGDWWYPYPGDDDDDDWWYGKLIIKRNLRG